MLATPLYPVEEVPVASIVVNKDVPQFKAAADAKTGEVDPLKGTYQRLGTAPIVVWEKASGEREVITGRHRLGLARRTNEATIPAQIVRESDGFTRDMALIFDAESNIRDGQGEIKDYANYFKNAAIDRDQATARGLLRGSKGNSGWHLGKDATDDLYTLYANSQIPEAKAVAIARGAPGNAPAQASGMRAAKTKSGPELELYVRNLAQLTSRASSGEQLGFGGIDSSFADFEREAGAIAKVQAEEIAKARALVLAAKGAANRPESARKMGLPVNDPAALLERITTLENRIAALNSPDSATFDELRKLAGLPVATPEPTIAPTPPLADPNQNALFEQARPYAAAHTRYIQLRALERDGKLTPAGQAELDAVERGLGQDFLDFYTPEKSGTPTSLLDQPAAQRAEMQRRADARLTATDLQSQVDLFGPTTDKKGQFSLFEATSNRYLDARAVSNPIAREAVRGLLSAVFERRLARQMSFDFATDRALVDSLDPAPRPVPTPPGPAGQGDGLGGSLRDLPNAQLGAHAGGLQLEARLYTQAFLAEGFLAHTGRKFGSTAELISAAQVLRNRNVETFWVLPYDAEGRLLAPLAFTSRLPNTVNLGPDYVDRFKALLGQIKPVSFDVLHNHPSGRPTPSRADIAFTRNLGEAFGGFRNHYVINHGTYSVITGTGFDGTISTVPEVLDAGDPTANRPGPYLQRRINSVDEALRLGYDLQKSPGNVTIFFANSEGVTVASASVALEDTYYMSFAHDLRNLATGVGAIEAFAYYDGPDLSPASFSALITEGVFTDAIVRLPNGNLGSMRVVDGLKPTARLHSDKYPPTIQLAEDSTAYAAPDPTAPTHFVSQFDRTPVAQPLAQMDLVRPIEMPELVNLVKQLAGTIPTLRNLPRANGYMRGEGRGKIVLDRRIFSDSVFAQQVLAHELGHLIDYLPDQTLNRGNILGRIASLRDFLRNALPLDPANPTPTLTPKERAQLRRDAEKQVGARPDPEEEADLAAWQNEVRIKYSELLQSELESRGMVVARGRSVEGGAEVIGEGDIGREIKDLSFWWRPLSPDATESYLAYRNSSVELYADALSVLFNAPKEFRDRAPTVWQMWFAYLDRKPEAKAAMLSTWDLLHQGAAAVSASRTANLRTGFAKAEEILLAKAAEREARRNSLPAIVEHFKQKHFNIYAPIIDRARKVRASGRAIPFWQDPEFVLDAHPLAENANYRFLDRMQKTVLTPLEDLGIDDATLGEFLFFNRVAHEAYQVNDQLAGRGVVANPQGHTAQTARRELLVMRYRLGPARYEAMQLAAQRFQDLTMEVIEHGHAAGIYSDEQLALAQNNRHAYATFAVVDFLEQSPHIPAAFRQSRGTLRDIANPFLATVLKMLTAHKFAELNQGKRVAVQLLTAHFPDEIALAPVSRIPLAGGRVMFRAKPAPDGKRDLVVLDQGRPVTWHVDPEIATMFEHSMPASSHAIIGVANWVFRNVFYPSFLTYNAAFQLWSNPVRDLSRSYVKLPPGAQRRKFIGEQLRASRGARARMLQDISTTQLLRRRTLRTLADHRPLTPAETAELQLLDDRALIIELLATRGISTPFESYASNPTRHDVWGRMLAEYRLAPDDTAATTPALRQWLGIVPGLGKVLDKLEFAGQVAEAMPKLGAYRVLTRELGWTADQAAYFVRNHIGTPNFTKRGQWTALDGTIFPFINIFMRGLEADLQQVRGRIPGVPITPKQQKFSYWRRMAERTLVPRLLQAMAAAGLLGYGLKKYYDAWADYEKANYLILPLGTTHDGSNEFGYKAAGVRIPEDETARLLGGIIHYLVQSAATQDDPAAKASLGNLVNFAGGQLPGVNPVITLADGWMQYSSGINPRDRLRGNPVMSDTEFKAGGWDSLSGMAAWTWDEVGGSNFIRFDPRAQTWQEHTIGALPVLNRVVKVTDAGLRERQRTLESALDTRTAQIRMAMPDNVNELLREYYGLNAIRTENRTDLQRARLAELNYWHSKVWTPNLQLMQDAPKDVWKSQGQSIGEISQAFEK